MVAANGSAMHCGGGRISPNKAKERKSEIKALVRMPLAPTIDGGIALNPMSARCFF